MKLKRNLGYYMPVYIIHLSREYNWTIPFEFDGADNIHTDETRKLHKLSSRRGRVLTRDIPVQQK